MYSDADFKSDEIEKIDQKINIIRRNGEIDAFRKIVPMDGSHYFYTSDCNDGAKEKNLCENYKREHERAVHIIFDDMIKNNHLVDPIEFVIIGMINGPIAGEDSVSVRIDDIFLTKDEITYKKIGVASDDLQTASLIPINDKNSFLSQLNPEFSVGKNILLDASRADIGRGKYVIYMDWGPFSEDDIGAQFLLQGSYDVQHHKYVLIRGLLAKYIE